MNSRGNNEYLDLVCLFSLESSMFAVLSMLTLQGDLFFVFCFLGGVRKKIFPCQTPPTVTVGLALLMNIAKASQAQRFCFLVVFLIDCRTSKTEIRLWVYTGLFGADCSCYNGCVF